LRVEFKSKAVVHLDQHKAPIASASLADNGSVHTVAINALTVFDVVHAYQLSKGKKYDLRFQRARNMHHPAHMQRSQTRRIRLPEANAWKTIGTSNVTTQARTGRDQCGLLRTSVDNSQGRLPRLGAGCLLIWALMRLRSANQNRGPTMAKRKKQSSKVQKKKGAKARPKAKKLSKAARGKVAAKRTVAGAKAKRAPAKKRMKQPTAQAVETVAVEVVEQPAPGVITVTEVEETELPK
jgi:hypothetical protein